MFVYHIPATGAAPRLTRIPLPDPGPHQLQVAIRACALNFADLLMIKGTYQDTPRPPFTLGLEIAGKILSVGDSVEGFAPGDRVAVYSGQGGLAEAGVFEACRAVKIPDHVSFETAAAFPIAYGTSHLALDHRARMQPGETLLVLGAAGGVGLTAVEIGKLMGARVIACARGADKLEVARAAGADHLIDIEAPDLRDRIIALGRADVVYDPVGGAAFQAAFRACNPEARLLPIGFASGDVPQVPSNHLMVKNLSVLGVNWGGYMRFAPDVLTGSLRTLLGWIAEGRLTPHVSHVLPLSRAAEGLELIRTRQATGKVVIVPDAG
ncbi:MAG: zinc-binding dehydrogenase [Rhodobacteraceae bacterium]|nr:zinc-binding dehydrogenase [Paracoccaceae bacterium]MAY46447.1 zinc-binding dehydrogenase [Paracoccaceae bacterium]QEW19181.1 Quinone oxidoreductase 1 [Marinibacterium anthonyi]